MPSYFCLVLRARTSLDDSLDVVAAHGVGGTVGALLTGVFANKALNGLADGALFGNPWQIVVQATAIGATLAYAASMSFALLKLVGAIVPLRASADDESAGLDISQHGEEAYVHAEGSATLTAQARKTPRPAVEPPPAVQSVPAVAQARRDGDPRPISPSDESDVIILFC